MTDGFYPPVHASARARYLILIVEDELLIRLVIADAVHDSGYRVIEADSGDEALEILKADVPVDVVFSDVRMPGLVDGIGLLSYIRSSRQAIGVVITSGHLDPGEALTRGADAFLAKPYRIEDVTQLVDRHIEQLTKGAEWPKQSGGRH